MDIEQMKKDLGGGNVFPIGEENVAFAKYFTGECYLNMLTTERVPVGLVTFAPGTINAYHIHHKGGQILLVTGGRGWYQEEGKPEVKKSTIQERVESYQTDLSYIIMQSRSARIQQICFAL